MPHVTRFAGVVSAVAIIGMAQPGAAQPSAAFAPPVVAGGLAGAMPVDSFDERHFEATLDGPTGIQPANPVAAEARRQGLIDGLTVAMEIFIDQPTTLLFGGILRSSNDNNIGGTNNP